MIDDKALFAIQCGLFVVGARDDKEQLVGCTVDAFVQSTAFPPTVILCSQHQTQTNVCIKATGCFSVSVLRHDVEPFVVANFGFQSSRNVQKWQNVSYKLTEGLPHLTSAAAWYVCKVIFAHELSTHTLFVCELSHVEMGEGESLSYDYYRKHMRQASVAAFQAFKKAQVEQSSGRGNASQ